MPELPVTGLVEWARVACERAGVPDDEVRPPTFDDVVELYGIRLPDDVLAGARPDRTLTVLG